MICGQECRLVEYQCPLQVAAADVAAEADLPQADHNLCESFYQVSIRVYLKKAAVAVLGLL